MVGLKKTVSFDKRQLVVFHHAQGKSYSDISKLVNISRNTVKNIVRGFDREGRLDYNYKNAGSPQKLNEREKRLIVRKVKQNPQLSAPKLTVEIANECHKCVNLETVRCVLRKEGLNRRVAHKKPYVNERNRRRRLEFALEHYLKNENFWTDVLFCDKSKFNVFGSDGRRMVWRKKTRNLSIRIYNRQ